MAIVWVREDFDGRTSDTEQDGTIKYTRQFHVLTDDRNDGPDTVRLATGVPRIGQQYSSGNDSNPSSFCETVEVDTHPDSDDGLHWQVTATYSTLTVESGEEDPDPRLRPPTYRWDMITYQVVAERGQLRLPSGVLVPPGQDAPIVNSALDVFDPPIQMDETRMTLTVDRNEANPDPARSVEWADVLNDNRFMFENLSIDPGMMKLSRINQSREFAVVDDVVFAFFPTTYEFHIRRSGFTRTLGQANVPHQGWDRVILDHGWREVAEDNQGRWNLVEGRADVSITETVNEPRLLDGFGRFIPVEDPQNFAAGSYYEAAQWRIYSVYDYKDFSQLGIF